MSIENLDISIGQAISWHGCEGCIMDIYDNDIVIEVCGETFTVDADEFAEQNEDLVID